jgi:AsmA protein
MARQTRGRGPFIWLAAIATVIGVVIWITSGAPLDAERLKAAISRGVVRATGRTLAIQGILNVSPGLSPTISGEGISLSNEPGAAAPSMLTAKSLRAHIALLPLLTGQVVLQDVTLDGADIEVESGPDGRLNWQFQPPARPLVPDTGATSSGASSSRLDLHRVQLLNSTLHWRLPGGSMIVAVIDDGEVEAPRDDAPMQASAHGKLNGVPVKLSVHAGSFSRLEGGPVTALAGAWPCDVSLTAGDATLRLNGGVNHPDEWRGYAFLLTANAPDLAPLAPWLPTMLALPLKDVNLTARLSDGGNGTFRTSALSLHAGNSDLGAAIPGLLLKEALLSAPGPGQQAQLSIDGTYQGSPLRMTATSTQPDVLSGETPLPMTFSAEAGTASISARGTIPPAPNANGLDLTLNVRIPKLTDLSALARRPLPDVRDVNFGAHAGDAGVRLRGVDLREIGFESSLGDITGNLTVAWAPVLTLNGSLESKQFDLDGAIAAVSMFGKPASPAPPATPPMAAAAQGSTMAPAPVLSGLLISDQNLPFAALQGADGDLSISADRMVFAGETYHDVQMKMVAAGGRVVVNPIRMSAPQGILIGGLTIDASAAPAQVALTLRSPGLSAAKIAGAMGYQDGATGAVQLDAELNATGASPHALAASLDGHLGISLVGGSISDSLLQALLGPALSQAGVQDLAGDVPVRCFASRTDFTQGTGNVRALALDTPQITLDGTGTIDLADETVALHIRPVVRVGGTGVAAPISLSGHFGELKAQLDPVLGGRVGISIGGAAPGGGTCASLLATARGGMPGPLPVAGKTPGDSKVKKPVDLLRGLFH